MPRRPRLVVPNIPLHIIQRGNNRQACFYSDDDYIFYLEPESVTPLRHSALALDSTAVKKIPA